jgi:hypothetical protein
MLTRERDRPQGCWDDHPPTLASINLAASCAL